VTAAAENEVQKGIEQLLFPTRVDNSTDPENKVLFRL
jgi:hypothetical protein